MSSLVYQAWIPSLRSIPRSLSEYKMFRMMYNLVYGNRMTVTEKHSCQKANVRTIRSSLSLTVCIPLLGILASDWNTTQVQHPVIASSSCLQVELLHVYRVLLWMTYFGILFWKSEKLVPLVSGYRRVGREVQRDQSRAGRLSTSIWTHIHMDMVFQGKLLGYGRLLFIIDCLYPRR